MACKKKQKGMVFRHERPTTSAAANQPPAGLVVRKPAKASEVGPEQSSIEGAAMIGKANMHPSKDPVRASGGLPAVKRPTTSNPHPDNLSPDSTCKGIRVTLDNNSMWNEFFRCKTEMILTKQGSRMFPYCRFRISGLQPSRKYSLIMDIQPLDNSRYNWTSKSWQAAGKAECHVKSQPFAHPESPSTGQHWMQNPVSFYKLKLTNNTSEQAENTTLHPMHRYLPRLHVVQTDKAAKDIKLIGPSVITFTFPQTEFMAVTAYQNSRFAQLKVDYNPFAKGLKEDGSASRGLKLNLNSGKDSHKDGGAANVEHPPVKKSLKSLLANNKPRSVKAADSKPLVSGALQKNLTTNTDQSSAKVPGESLCSNSRPDQKLFSELIREAHVSLQRCNLEQLNINNSTSHRTEPTNSKSTKGRGCAPQKESVSTKTPSETSAKNGEKVLTQRKTQKDNTSTDWDVSAPVVSQTSSVDSDAPPKPDASSEVNVKQNKRLAPLPLPALALFLKQRLTKSKKAKTKQDSSPALPSESLSGSQTSGCWPSDDASSATGPSKDFAHDGKECTVAVACTSGQAVEKAHRPCSPSHPDAITEPKVPMAGDFSASISAPESLASDLAVPSATPVFPNSDQLFCTIETFTSNISSTLATSSSTPDLSTPLVPELNCPNAPQIPTITESSALPSDSSSRKSDLLLLDQECSPFGFECLSPASSPEHLPPLPNTLALELDCNDSEPTLETVEEFSQSESSNTSVFKWHTVLPPPVPYIDNSFTTFEHTSQTSPLESITSPLLPSQTSPHSEPQTLETSTSMAPPGPASSFQEDEQLLPFPSELSPHLLQLPLSPSFSSLDGDGLSPTPSITDLVNFFSTEDDLGMGGTVSNSDAVEVTCPPPATVEENTQEPSQQVQEIPAKQLCKSKKSPQQKLADMDTDQKMEDSTYISMRPNLEEVEEQLFISFTSKEALKLHIGDISEETASGPQTTPEGQLLPPGVTPADNAESVESICVSEEILLRDLKVMKHRQVIHPVLQEVGLKMSLLDPFLAIDLQYLGVRLPIPPPGVSLEPLPPQAVSAAFVSRTGKTTDVTQIKGWREKFTPSQAPAITPSSSQPEAGPSSDQPKKNLSAFCSDMLDEYLENEGKLIDERASSFSQPVVEPVEYKLPARGTSYVRTLDSVLKKHTPTADLISGFIPPSKRPKLSLKERKTRKVEKKQKAPKQTKLRPEPGVALDVTTEPGPAEIDLVPKKSAGVTVPCPLEPTSPTIGSQTSAFKKRKKLKPKTSSQTLSPSKSTTFQPGVSEDLAPLESDSELGAADPGEGAVLDSRPLITRALLRQRDLEDGVVWEGRTRTSITVERAAIALTSLFTLKGFVSENPTAPIQLIRRRAPPCLNDFCRLGCICSSLAHCSRTSHCGRPPCMFGCSCLKQKVVLLKNLDGSDSSPSHQAEGRRRRRKKRMKMAYVLKEADSVSQPAERVRTLWRRVRGDSDPEPTHVPETTSLSCSAVNSCARSRGYRGKRRSHKEPESSEEVRSCARVRGYRRKRRSHQQMDGSPTVKPKVQQKPRDLNLTEAESRSSSPPPTAGDVARPQTPPPRPSKRLIIMAECQWTSDAHRDHVLLRLCEEMALDRLDKPFRIGKYLIGPVSQTLEESGSCIQYKVHISEPRLVQEPQPQGNQSTETQQQDPQTQVSKEEPSEDWQREVDEGDFQEEEEPLPKAPQAGAGGRVKMKGSKKKKMVNMALPFLTGISPAGFLSARRKKAGGTDHLVQVNGKLYPLAKIQLGKMGALHPANRLAAYLTGRVGSSRKQPGASLSVKPPLSSGPALQTLIGTSCKSSVPPGRPQPSVTVLRLPTSSTGLQPAALTLDQPAGGAPEGTKSQVVAVRVYPNLAAGGSHARAAGAGSAPSAASHVSSSVVRPVNLGPAKGLAPLSPDHPAPGQKMILQPVRTASGAQYYRIPDGKLVQLLPISKLKPVPSALPAHRDVAAQTSPQTSKTAVATSSSSSSFSLSGLKSFSVLPGSSPLRSGSVSQKPMCTLKILPTNSSKEPIIITCPKLPSLPPTKVVTAPSSFTLLQAHLQPPAPPLSLISHQPFAGGAEFKVSKLASSQTSLTPTDKTLISPPPAPGSKVAPTPAPTTEPEMELDILCVDDEAETTRTHTMEPVDPTGSSSGDTENSSDFGDESTNEEETMTMNQRHNHSMLERMRRTRIQQRFKGLRKELGLSGDRTSKISTLQKAIQIIQDLRTTDTDLKKQKRTLRRLRDKYLSTIVPSDDVPEQRGGAEDEDPSDGTDDESTVRSAASETVPETTDMPSNQRKMERHRASNQLKAALGGGVSDQPSAGVGGSDRPTGTDEHEMMAQAPPTNTSTRPPTTPDQPHAPVPLSQRVLQTLAPPPVSQHAPWVSVRPRTVPNILSRSKRAPRPSLLIQTMEGDAPPIQALVAADVVSLLGAALPGQHLVTLGTSASPEVASLNPNFPGLGDQQDHLTSPTCPPTSDSALFTNPTGLRTDGGAEDEGGGDNESLTSLLKEIVFLSQRNVSTASDEVAHAVGGASEQNNTRSMDRDCETEAAGLQGQVEKRQTEPHTGLASDPQSGVLAPPPLMQMKVGGAKMTDTTSLDRVEMGGDREEGGVAWRPMPRLVPLGLRGNPPC